MKRIKKFSIKALVSFLIFTFIFVSMTACESSVEGTYEATTYDNEKCILILTEKTYQISSYDENGIYIDSMSEYGNYEIEGKSITFSPLGGIPYICTFERDGKDILIDGGFFEKQ